MLPAKTANQRLTALNSAFFFMAISGLLYFLYGYLVLQRDVTEKNPASPHSPAQHNFLFMLCMFEAITGLYITQAAKKFFLFVQSLATMLVFTAHALAIYQFHTETGSGLIAVNLVTWSYALIFAAVILLTLVRLEHLFKKIRKPTLPEERF